uniref:Uncharacterized protein n=1 Tax=Glossina austeni TaxID=7395 RepID=A0A1A9UD96_GLOAU
MQEIAEEEKVEDGTSGRFRKKISGTLNQFATLRSEVDALKETAANQQFGVGDSASKVQAPYIDGASNVLCKECPKRQNKNKRPKAPRTNATIATKFGTLLVYVSFGGRVHT